MTADNPLPPTDGPARVIAALRRHRLVVATCLVGAAAAGAALWALAPVSYRSKASVLVTPTITSAEDQLVRPDQLINMETENQILTSNLVRELVAPRVGADEAETLDVSASVVPGTQVIKIAVTARTPLLAQGGADAWVTGYLEHRRTVAESSLESRRIQLEALSDDLYDQLADTTKAYAKAKPSSVDGLMLKSDLDTVLSQIRDVARQLAGIDGTILTPGEVTEPAARAVETRAPLPLYVAGALVLGLVLGLGLALLLERRAARPRIPEVAQGPGTGQVVDTRGGPASAQADLWLGLRVLLDGPPGPSRVLVSPVTPGSERDRTAAAEVARRLGDAQDAPTEAPAPLSPEDDSASTASTASTSASTTTASAATPGEADANAGEAEGSAVGVRTLPGSRTEPRPGESRVVLAPSLLSPLGAAMLERTTAVVLVLRPGAGRDRDLQEAVRLCEERDIPVLATVLVN